jgi:hypothetical protein
MHLKLELAKSKKANPLNVSAATKTVTATKAESKNTYKASLLNDSLPDLNIGVSYASTNVLVVPIWC